jgi:glyoxylase I family protein
LYIEHIGISVSNPLEMADWYVKNLGFTAVRKIHKGEKADSVFIADSASKTVLELVCEPGLEPVGRLISNPSQLHLAFYSDDPQADCEKLVSAGASFESETKAAPGDTLLYLRDPWGNIIQLVKRQEPLIKTQKA